MNNIEELSKPVAEVNSKYGDPEAFGERELNVLADIQKMPYQTKFYSQEYVDALIAQLEVAQKERDALREVHIGAGSNTRSAADIYFQLVEELEVPAGGSLVGVIDNLKAELSAANEKLSKPVSLPDDGLEDCISMWPDNWRNDFDTGYNFGLWRCEQNIKAAGFTVEE